MMLKKAIECFEEAIRLEPGYAHAYGMAASCYAFLGGTGQLQPKAAFQIVHDYSDKALKLDSLLSVSYSAKASAYLFYDWNWKKAYEHLQKALKLNPAETGAHQLLCFYFMISGRKQDAVDIMEKAALSDPLSTIINQYLAESYLFSGRPDLALKKVEALLDIYPQMRVALELKGWCTGASGDWKKAAEIFEEVYRLAKNPSKGITPLAVANARLGNSERALELLDIITRRQIREPGVVMDVDLAMIWWALGDKDKTFHHLFQCIEKRMGAVAILIDHPMFRGIDADPRYRVIKQQLGVDEFS